MGQLAKFRTELLLQVQNILVWLQTIWTELKQFRASKGMGHYNFFGHIVHWRTLFEGNLQVSHLFCHMVSLS